MSDVEGHTASGATSPRLQVVFQSLRYTVQVKAKARGTTERAILKDVDGVLDPARLTAVMGASGAGKTSLLNVLAGFTKPQDRVTGSISVNGLAVSVNKMRRISGFVHQEDVILHTMTVREALLFSAMLKLPSSMPRPYKVQRALDVAQLLNLQKSLDSVVGSAMIKGISGGEKRRLSLGMEMVTEPSILFLDEPSSGLDAFNAFKVIHILRSVAHHHHRTVVCTIHQPSSEVFHMFDDLLVLAEGQVIYLGEVEGMVEWFSSLGYRCPTYTNPADYLFMDILNAAIVKSETADDSDHCNVAAVIAQDKSAGPPSSPLYAGNPSAGSPAAPAQAATPSLKATGRAPTCGPAPGPAPGATTTTTTITSPPSTSRKAPVPEPRRGQDADEEARIAALIAAWKGSPQSARLQHSLTHREFLDTGISKEAEGARAPFWLQLLLLAKRAGRNAWRNPLVVKGKLAQTVFLSLVVGLIYLQLDDDLTGVQDRQGSLFFLVVESLFGSVMGVLTVFGAEKAVFQREYGNRMYGLPAYFVSRWLVELPAQTLMPILSSVICYWMIGYQNKVEKFWWFALVQVLMNTCGAGLGIFVSCLFNDLSVALAVMPMFLLPLMVFSGFFVNADTIPPYFTWIQYISPMHYGFIALVKNEFSGLKITCTPEQGCAPGFNGDSVIRNMGFDDQGSVGQNAGILFAMMWGLLILAYIALWLAVRRRAK